MRSGIVRAAMVGPQISGHSAMARHFGSTPSLASAASTKPAAGAIVSMRVRGNRGTRLSLPDPTDELAQPPRSTPVAIEKLDPRVSAGVVAHLSGDGHGGDASGRRQLDRDF